MSSFTVVINTSRALVNVSGMLKSSKIGATINPSEPLKPIYYKHEKFLHVWPSQKATFKQASRVLDLCTIDTW
jgi:hypothetical protein